MARQKSLVLAVLVLGFVLAVAVAEEDRVTPASPTEAYKELKADISHLNLIRGLELSDSQLADVIEILSLWKMERDSRERQIAAAMARAEQALAVLRANLVKLGEVPEEINRAAAIADYEVHALVEGSGALRLWFAEQVAAVLNENQLILVSEFAPCLIPPKGTRDETRIGAPPPQEGLAGQVGTILARIREIPQEVYAENRDAWCRHALDVLFHRPYDWNDPYIVAVRDHILKVVDEARALSDVDFDVQREQLARRIVPLAHPLAQTDNRQVQLAKVQSYFLDPRMLEVLLDLRKERGANG